MCIRDWSSDVCSSDLIALGEDFLGSGERFQRLAERGADGRHLGQFGRRQVIEVLVHRVAGMDLVLNDVEPDRKSVVEGKSVSGRVDLGGSRLVKKNMIRRYCCNTKYQTKCIHLTPSIQSTK